VGSSAGSLFVAEDDAYRPTQFARGPFAPATVHGGPVAALIAREAELCEPDEDLRVARLTVELVRPVSLSQLQLEARLIRPGRNVQLVEVVARQDEAVVAAGRALRIRAAEIDIPDVRAATDRLFGPPESGVAMTAEGVPRAFHSEGAEVRFVEGSPDAPGPATVWVRLCVPLVAGEQPSALQRAVAAAELATGVSSPLSFGDWLFINPDLTIHLSRLPVGEWVALESHTSAEHGIGIAESRLWDEEGPIGRSVQSLLIEKVNLA
jgi:Thioesterase-like superfamily